MVGSEEGHGFGDLGGKDAALLLLSATGSRGRRAEEPKKILKQMPVFPQNHRYFSVLNTLKPHLCLRGINGDLKFLAHVALGRTR